MQNQPPKVHVQQN